jgi:outer membrane protein TolC
LGDAERALNQFRFARQAYVLQQQAVVSIEQDFRNAQRRYKSGDTGVVELLDAERQLRDAQEGLARAQSNAAIDLVSLYKSLGGGWGAPLAEVINQTS